MKALRKTVRAAILASAISVALGSCAGPPLKLYTLGAGHAEAEGRAFDRPPVIIAVARVTLPDELDNDDILVRSGPSLLRSSRGRWSARLSTEVTERLTAQLAARRPDALVTSSPQGQTPSYRIIITLSRFDVSVDGHATLAADWLIVPSDPAASPRRDRTTFTMNGSVATDQDVVLLLGSVMDRLGQSIDLTNTD
jgi:uncharacterized lipoprotein YmbA